MKRFLDQSAVMGVMNDYKDALDYDLENGLPLAALFAINRIPGLMEEISRLHDILETIYNGALVRKAKDERSEWAYIVEMIEREIPKKGK